MGEIVLCAEGLRKSYFRSNRSSAASFDAVVDANLQLASGEFVVLSGRSGSGKTTLLTMLAGLLVPSEGRVLLEGEELYTLPDARLSRLRSERIAMVAQGQAAIHSLTVLQNVLLAQLLYRPVNASDETRAAELLERFDIAPLAGCYPAELSGGELRRMSLARALVLRPHVLLADEPTADLDDASAAQVLAVLQEAADSGCAVLVVTHDAAVEAYATRQLIMNAGRLSIRA